MSDCSYVREYPFAELAIRLGYQSEAAFSRAFKRFMGVSPGAFRWNGDAANGQRSSLGIS